MVNKVRGEVRAQFGGEYITLVASFGAICELEDLFDCPFSEIGTKLGEGVSVTRLVKMVKIFAKGGGASKKQTDLIDKEQADIVALTGWVTACITSTLPEGGDNDSGN